MPRFDWDSRAKDWVEVLHVEESRAEALLQRAKRVAKAREGEFFQWAVVALNAPTRSTRCPRLRFLTELLLKFQGGSSDLPPWRVAPVYALPEIMFKPLVRAAVYEPDPSDNEFLICPAAHAFGLVRVRDELLRYATRGTNREKAGAVNAWYFVPGGCPPGSWTYADLVPFNDWMIAEFIANKSVRVRQSLIGMIGEPEPDYFSQEALSRMGEVAQIAASHRDRYIRERGPDSDTVLFGALPYRD